MSLKIRTLAGIEPLQFSLGYQLYVNPCHPVIGHVWLTGFEATTMEHGSWTSRDIPGMSFGQRQTSEFYSLPKSGKIPIVLVLDPTWNFCDVQ